MSHQVRPFKIAVPDAALERLRSKLAAATFPAEAGFSDDWNAGAPLRDVQRLAEHWRDGFDWRAHEARLNKALPQFTTPIAVDGGFGELELHFVHRRSSREDSIPLLFCHGWPGSFLEVIKILPLLAEPKDGGPSFHVVAPSLPNFGFSEAVTKRGFGLAQYAECLHRLMLKLGYHQYVTQGGDFGFFITRMIGLRYPEHCLASHVNMLVVRPSLPGALWLGIRHALGWTSALERAGLSRSWHHLLEGSGYSVLQATKPATPGLALADSPVALLAWVYEKLHHWTDEYPWTDDDALTWVSVYQFSTAGPAASLRIYYELSHGSREQIGKVIGYVPRVPLGISRFPKDLLVLPKAWGSLSGPVVFDAEHTEGGHFAAYECPDVLVADLRSMFSSRGGANDVARRFDAV
ncbi:alpha/beta hydrolase fold domain-containing protein [Hirsutella rhossiliensis]|uniref:Alpha/beta hydrolase fold domain-containing protein n=1 Tax=Hirsutella rhossiliensis TaxID=111463 RepID=A0A9P8SEU0_9HYPO|nr:alpha/beta hydrolase fold domain-containing protein [Hirsutella rhossiliensis]KAH0960168.1 alpha/beta hydrolase fold domain-containing protein [Hirsutella rhossiliensis]